MQTQRAGELFNGASKGYLPLSLYLSIYLYIYISISISISLFTYIYIYIHTHLSIYVQICIYTCIFISLSLYLYLSLSLHIYIYIYIHTYTTISIVYLSILPSINPLRSSDLQDLGLSPGQFPDFEAGGEPTALGGRGRRRYQVLHLLGSGVNRGQYSKGG